MKEKSKQQKKTNLVEQAPCFHSQRIVGIVELGGKKNH